MTTTANDLLIGLRVPPCAPIGQVADVVGEAESLGYDQVFVPDSQLLWRDSYATLVACAMQTSRVTLGTAVTNFVTRHPSVVASLSRTLAEVSNGRFQLGIGVGNSSVEPIGLHPSRQGELRESVATVRSLLAGDAVDFNGVKSRLRDPYPDVPIHLAASGPKNLQLAGEIADGAILLSGVSPATLANSARLVRIGAVLAGKPESGVALTVSAHCHVTDDVERDARMLKPICAGIAQHGGKAALEIAGIEINVPKYVEGVYPDLVHAEDWDLAVERSSEWVTDAQAVAFADEFCLFGSAESIVARLRLAQDAGATAVFLQHVGSYDLPHRLMRDFATEVMPLLKAG